MNKKDYIRSLNNANVKVIAKGWIDNADMEAGLRAQLAARGVDWTTNVTDTGNAWQFSNGQFLFKERRLPEHTARLVATSAKFAYTSAQCGPVRCEYADFVVNDDGSLESARTLIIPLA